MPEIVANPDHYLVSANGRLGASPLSASTEVDRILSLAAQRSPAYGLVIHFHGGLNSQKFAVPNIVAPLTGIYRTADA